MYQTVAYENLKGNYILIDVRSPGEHQNATIPGAFSLPIFDDEERSRIGHVYVNESVEKAKRIGIEAVSARLPMLFSQILEWNQQYDQLVFFCAKGGMRSASVVALMVELGIKACKLKDGYKGYRAFINARLPEVNESINYIVLHGKTGTGKTRILNKLKELGYDVLDLEATANHRGSLLGGVGLGQERSQKQFESLIYESLIQAKSSHVFVEGESKRIGNMIIPHYIFETMKKGSHLLVSASLDFRADALIQDYIQDKNSTEELKAAIESLSKYIGEKPVEKYVDLINAGDYKSVATELMVAYYDPMYANEFNKYDYDLVFEIDSVEVGVRKMIDWFKTRIK